MGENSRPSKTRNRLGVLPEAMSARPARPHTPNELTNPRRVLMSMSSPLSDSFNRFRFAGAGAHGSSEPTEQIHPNGLEHRGVADGAQQDKEHCRQDVPGLGEQPVAQRQTHGEC